MPRPLPPLPKAVFCHAQWRTGSTALFNAFRADPRFMCFYEPLHEGLRTLTRQKCKRYDPDDVRRMGHHGLTKSYFWEYRGLLGQRRGVPAFPSGLSYKEFFEVSAAGRRELHRYFDLLSDLACSRNKIPVFCLNRSWGRMEAFRAMFPDSVHVFSLRDPNDTWRSQQARRSYFFAKLLYLFSEAEPIRIKHLFPEIADLTLLERIRTERTFKRKISHISDQRIAPLFWEAYACALLNGVLYADFILDLSPTASKPDDRQALGQYLARLPMLCEGQPLPHGIEALAQSAPAASPHRTSALPQCCPSYPLGPVAKLLGNRDRLRMSACQAGPKLSPANRAILGNLIWDGQELAGNTHTA